MRPFKLAHKIYLVDLKVAYLDLDFKRYEFILFEKPRRLRGVEANLMVIWRKRARQPVLDGLKWVRERPGFGRKRLRVLGRVGV